VERLEVPVDDPELGHLVLTALTWGPADGRPVLLLHGFPQSSFEWRAVGERLAGAGLRAVALDQRGVPATARPPDTEAYRMPRLVADVLGAADTLFGPGAAFDLVGHDWGAAVAWQVAARHPERVRSLVAVSVPHPRAMSRAMATDPRQREMSAYMLRWREPGAGERELLDDDARRLREVLGGGRLPGVDVEAYVAQAREPGALTAGLQWYRAVTREDVGDAPDVSVPVTMVWPSEDLAIGRTAAEGTRRCVSGDYRFVELPGASHWAPEEAADRVADEVLARIGAPRGA
jgi:pimeloyl-ACP methyl ester carboxylesterase